MTSDSGQEGAMAKLDVKAFGLATGLVWGSAMFILGIVNMAGSWGHGIQELMATLYIGYRPTILGSVLGGVWGFFDAGIGGMIMAWLYNKMSK